MSTTRPALYVEGKNDEKAIGSLLCRHGIDTDSKTRQFDIKPPASFNEKSTESVEALLESIPESVRRSDGRPIGFVFDADFDIQSRWSAIRNRLVSLGVTTPDQPELGGFIAEVPRFQTRVGVWLMPNNLDVGMLEDFLQGLIADGDKLLPIAREATTNAMATELRFPKIHEPKALIHTWLAWQEKPGLPFGTAITATYFRHDTTTALAFVAWFRNLFQIEPRRS